MSEQRDVLLTLQRIARPLAPVRFVAVVAGLVSTTLFMCAVLAIAPFNDSHTIPALLGVLWSTALFSFIVAFQQVPPHPDTAERSWARFKLRLARGWHLLVATALGLLSLTLVWLSYRLLSLWAEG